MSALLVLFSLLGLVPGVDNLARIGNEATATQRPILLYISRSDCTFCRRFEEQQLGPLIRSGVYDHKIIFREVVWDAPEAMINFQGESVSRQAFARSFKATLTPTLLFLDGEGIEIVPRIVGYRANDYFGFYLESALQKAFLHMQKVHRQKPF